MSGREAASNPNIVSSVAPQNLEMGDLRLSSGDLRSESINPNQDLSQEKARLQSFQNWPENAPVGKQKLAKAGFFYTGKDYSVKCFSCNCEVNDWDFGDQAIQKHSATNPNCDFIKHISRSNRIPSESDQMIISPSETSPSSSLPRIPASYTQTNSTSVQNGPQSLPMASTQAPPNQLNAPAPPNRNTTKTARDNKIWHTFESLRNEAERLKTFKGWPLPFVTPEDLSRAGFFYLKDRDKVQCVYCRGIVGEWEVGDVPMTEHCRHFVNCPFVRGQNVGNIAMQNGTDIGPSTTTPNKEEEPGDITGLSNFQLFSRPEKGYVTNTELEEMGILARHHGPKHMNYVTREARLRSFAPWPKNFPQRPEDLADAGFYYAGVSDHVKCFYCDGGLRNWEPTDVPWIEHARWFSKCEFVILTKGREFIEAATQLHPPVLPNNYEQIGNIPQPRYAEITPVLLTSIMQTPIVMGVLEMGISEELVRVALVKQLQQTGHSFTTSGELLDMCLKLQEETGLERSSNKGPSHPVASTSTCPPQPLSPPSSSVSKVRGCIPTSASSMQSPVASGVMDLENKTKDLNLEEENQRLKEMRLCKVCMDEEIGVVFLPCGHLITCPKCAPSLQDCPMCRQQIRGTVRTFLS